MATKCVSAKVLNEKNKFEKMREDLEKKFSELTSLVNQRKCDLDRKINDLELEYNNNNKQIEKDKQTMRELREMAEQLLGQNTLLDVQNNIIKEISYQIQKLDSASKSQLELNWNFANIKQEIDRIDLKLAIPNEPRVKLKDFSIPIKQCIFSNIQINPQIIKGDEDDSDGSEEELPIIEGIKVELVKDAGSYLLRGKDGRVLKLAISESALSEIHNECLSLFDSDRLPHIRASDLEVISDTVSELTVHASVVGVSASYLARKYSEEEVAALSKAGSLPSHLLAVEKDWCVIEVEGFPTLFGSRDLMPED